MFEDILERIEAKGSWEAREACLASEKEREGERGTAECPYNPVLPQGVTAISQPLFSGPIPCRAPPETALIFIRRPRLYSLSPRPLLPASIRKNSPFIGSDSSQADGRDGMSKRLLEPGPAREGGSLDAVHPYWPEGTLVFDYAANDSPIWLLLGSFAVILGIAVGTVLFQAVRSNPGLRTSDRAAVCWFALCRYCRCGNGTDLQIMSGGGG